MSLNAEIGFYKNYEVYNILIIMQVYNVKILDYKVLKASGRYWQRVIATFHGVETNGLPVTLRRKSQKRRRRIDFTMPVSSNKKVEQLRNVSSILWWCHYHLSIEKWIKDPGYSRVPEFGSVFVARIQIYKYYFALFAFMTAINIFKYITAMHHNVTLQRRRPENLIENFISHVKRVILRLGESRH